LISKLLIKVIKVYAPSQN